MLPNLVSLREGRRSLPHGTRSGEEHLWGGEETETMKASQTKASKGDSRPRIARSEDVINEPARCS